MRVNVNIQREVAALRGYAPERYDFEDGGYHYMFRKDGQLFRRQEIPQWHDNLEEAIALFWELPDDYTPRLVRMITPRGEIAYTWKATIMHNVTHEEFEAEVNDPAGAVCLAWLMYKGVEVWTP